MYNSQSWLFISEIISARYRTFLGNTLKVVLYVGLMLYMVCG
jgi:hypothetical protein